MFPRVSPLCLAFAVVLATGRDVRAQLASKSPFMPPQAAATNAPTAGAPLEYRGYMETGSGMQYRIYDPARKAGAWVKLNERNADFDVTAKQQENDMLTLEHQGRTLTLELRKPKVVSSGSAAQAIPPPPTPVAPANVPPAVTQAVVLNPTPADEQRRLEAVAAEVARRRALREQATQQINQGQPPPVPVPTPPPAPVQPQVQGQGGQGSRGGNTNQRR